MQMLPASTQKMQKKRNGGRKTSRDDHFLVLVFSFAWLLHIYPHMAEICRERNVPTLQFPVFPKQLSK